MNRNFSRTLIGVLTAALVAAPATIGDMPLTVAALHPFRLKEACI